MKIKITEAGYKDHYPGGAWFDNYIGQVFEVIHLHKDQIPERYEVDTTAIRDEINARTAYVPVAYVEIVAEGA